MNVFKQMWLTWLRHWYEGKLVEIQQNRMYLVSQSTATHRMLDEHEANLKEKLSRITNRGEEHGIYQS